MGLKDDIIAKLPESARVTNSKYEGANVILYTSSKDFLTSSGAIIRKLVDEFKKRIEVRADSKLLAAAETVEQAVLKNRNCYYY